MIPSQLKIAKVVPIFKSGDSLNMDNYRPISLLNVFSKILEKIVHKRLSNHLETNKLLSPFQFGFRKNISTIHPLTKFLNFIAKSNNNNKFAIAMFCDLRKAFDTCDHSILLKKLKSLGVTGTELSWFHNYLTGRKQFVSIGGKSSSLLDILIGVPQGSILGPLLFLIYINDLPQCSQLLAILFADDTTLLASHENLNSLTTFVNAEFKKICFYFRQNKLSLHPKKTHFLLFSPNKNINPSNVILNIDNNNSSPGDLNYDLTLLLPVNQINVNSPIPAVKFLGVFIDPKLDFKYHVNYISGKISTAMYFLRSSKKFLTPQALKALYFTLVHCHLIYALPIWSCTTNKILQPIVTKQKIAIRLITGSKFNSHTEPLFKKLNIVPFNNLISISKLQIMQQFKQKLLPETLQEDWMLNLDRRNNQNMPTLRNHEEIFIPMARSTFVERLPLIAFPSLWSTFQDEDIKIIRNKLEFKVKIKRHFISGLNENYVCQRLLCPHCHLSL